MYLYVTYPYWSLPNTPRPAWLQRFHECRTAGLGSHGKRDWLERLPSKWVYQSWSVLVLRHAPVAQGKMESIRISLGGVCVTLRLLHTKQTHSMIKAFEQMRCVDWPQTTTACTKQTTSCLRWDWWVSDTQILPSGSVWQTCWHSSAAACSSKGEYWPGWVCCLCSWHKWLTYLARTTQLQPMSPTNQHKYFFITPSSMIQDKPGCWNCSLKGNCFWPFLASQKLTLQVNGCAHLTNHRTFPFQYNCNDVG